MNVAENPVNLGFRFVLEMGILFALTYWGWTQFSGIMRWIMSLVAPLIASVLWSTFRVNNDPGKAPIPVPGIVRLLLEFVLFGISVWVLYLSGQPTWAVIFAALVIIHYFISYQRIVWLLKQ